MAFEKHNFKDGDTLYAAQLNEIEDAILNSRPVIYVNDYGLANDGETDNLAAFNTLYAAHPHDVLVFNDGTYCFSGQIDTYDTHILLINATIKFTAAHGAGFNMMGYNREDVIGTISTITATEPNEFPSYGEFLKGIGGTIDGNYTAGTSLVSIGTGSYFEVSGLTIKNVGDGLTTQIAIDGSNPNSVGYKYERIVKDIKIINYDNVALTIGIKNFGDSYIDNIVIVNMRTGIVSDDISAIFNNIHIWCYNWNSANTTAGTIGINGDFIGSNVYFDSVDYGFATGSSPTIHIHGLQWFINSATNDGKETYMMFKDATNGNGIEITGIDIRRTVKFSKQQMTSGIFTGRTTVTVANLPTTWNYINKAEIDSPVFSGTPKAPNPDSSSNDNQIATTYFVNDVIANNIGGMINVDDLKTYTVTIPLDGTSAITYSDDASGMTAGSDDWDDKQIFSRIKPCVFKNGEVMYYLDKNNFNLQEDGTTAADLTGTDGNVMIEIPAFGYKISQDSTNLTVSITNDLENAVANGYTMNAFSYDSSCDCSAYYYGAYTGSVISNKLCSLPNQAPKINCSYTNFSTYALANGTYYEPISYFAVTAIQCLYLIKYANRSNDNAIGYGICGTTAISNTGGTETLGMNYGTTENQTTHMKLFGIEDFWGNAWELTSDLYAHTENSKIIYTTGTNNQTTYTTDKTYAKTWGTYVATIYGNNDLGFLEKTMSSSSGLFQDGGGVGAMSTTSQNSVESIGGGYDSGTNAGPFATYEHGKYETAAYLGSRLGYKKLGIPVTDTKQVENIPDKYLMSPNGTKYRLSIDDSGNLVTTVVSST